MSGGICPGGICPDTPKVHVYQQSSALSHDLVSVQLFPPTPAKSCPFQELLLSYRWVPNPVKAISGG